MHDLPCLDRDSLSFFLPFSTSTATNVLWLMHGRENQESGSFQTFERLSLNVKDAIPVTSIGIHKKLAW